ncbi:MAG: methyltransferase domain-containing protein [Rhodospirillales bacterium]
MNIDIESFNSATYRNSAIVGQYMRRDDILPGERCLFGATRDRLLGADLLDIGVGGGRTSRLMLDLARSYTGIDYSPQMVDACRKRFPDHADLFREADARNLAFAEDDSFDIVIFSFNGIDYIPHEGRLQALAEIRRVLRPGGLFLFSTHLTPSLLSRFAPTANPNSDNWLKDWRLRLLFHWFNIRVKDIDTAPYSLIRDASHSFRLVTYYSQPQTVIDQLSDAGFDRLRFFSNYEERELTREEFLKTRLNWAYLAAST